jgi:citrate lyase subunit beta / citryl-CoA lyase
MRPYRSVLFVPAHKPAWAEKALAAGADAIVVDLEDSVPLAEKPGARATAAATITALRNASAKVGLFVRVNPQGTGLTGADLEATVVPGLDGVFTPKVDSDRDIIGYDALVEHFEARNGVSGLEYIIPVETVAGIQNCREIAKASPRVGAMIGPSAEHADIARAVGYEWTPGGLEALYLRSRILLACREAGLHPLTALWERLEDLDGLRAFAANGRQLGFRGMIAIHPSHVPIVNATFSPSAADIEFHEGLLRAYEQAAQRGEGALRYRGVHIDKAHYDKAVDWLALAREQLALDGAADGGADGGADSAAGRDVTGANR